MDYSKLLTHWLPYVIHTLVPFPVSHSSDCLQAHFKHPTEASLV